MNHHEPWSTPLHRKDAMVWTNRAEIRARLRKAPRCPHCRKRQFKTKTDARSFLALIVTHPQFEKQPDDFLLRPYACPWGNGWHVGHDRKTGKPFGGSKNTMTSEEMKIDALLITATGRLMSAASCCSELRSAVLANNIEHAKNATVNLAEHMSIVDAVLNDVAKVIAAYRMVRTMTAQIAARQQGGLIH